MTPLKIGMIGLGTVGGGVAKILTQHPDRIERRAQRPIVLQRVAVRDLTKKRDVDLPAEILTDRVQDVIDDPEIDVAVQLIGGTGEAREIMLALLTAGKDVVTANKALLCEHGDELFTRARELGRSIAFEASVAGGIPIIAAFGSALAGNQITSLSGILNGTSNFILTEMADKNQTYEQALRRAQELGYAEADPAMDVDGTDAAQKLVLLSQLAFGVRAAVAEFPCSGIDTLTLEDLKCAAELGYMVKLLAVARLVDNLLEMHVSPTLVRNNLPMADVQGVFNAVKVTGDVVGETWFSGQGAGQLPTASAVLADIVDMAVGRSQLTFPTLDLFGGRTTFRVQPTDKILSKFYLRFNALDRPHVLADITDILGRHEISIASVVQHESPEVESSKNSVVPVFIMTHRATEGQMRAAEAELNQLKSLLSPCIRMRVAE
ncbi:Homoserine dehydrogenase [Symmachiella macrocystis]|uniref:Homoserine dehydrogenase n=1 Tax=Symmachiella macrocystis TaxID=2527985 RepID=A0A5C6BJN8_9PLAN|nr:homoserine dehydrogenase [Symmachiella macrocystis]TWU12373.1 Homoserine dehydrogenase [Symmachiella macrocystis]